ncbi:MAG: MopE-related protein [Myxococcota bacterium]|nr:MopE-related protein [Myxococcota bacterium]
MTEYALRISIFLAFLGGASGCVSWELPDLDGDGSPVGEDCNVLDPNIGPSQEEIWYDGIDQNCDGNDDDQDGDGFASVDSPSGEGVDCWDDPNVTPEMYAAVEGYEQIEAALVFPGAEDTWYDGIDSDCAGNSDFDQDEDGYDSATHPRQDGALGVDCVDGEENNHYLEESPAEWSAWTDLGFDEGDIHPEVAEDVCYDGINADCDETEANDSNPDPDSYRNDFDCDKDGFDIAQECDDENATILPNDDPDTWYDCIDSDCDGNDGDQDGDGYTPDFVLDANGAEIINYADSTSSVYCDLNQFAQHLGAGDCVDDPADVPPTLPGFTELDAVDIHSLITDVFYDGVDADCDGESDFDQDGDGYDSSEHARDAAGTDFGQDCNDTDANINPSRFEICESGTQVDQNCNGDANDQGAFGCTNYYTDLDADGHGVGSSTCRCEAYQDFTSLLANDCDDADATVSPSEPELCDGQDNDCNNDLPTIEVDDDGDGYVECPIDSGGWDGVITASFSEMLGDDCDDGDATENPDAPEICDGQANNCDGSIPSNEVDDDGDGYVECTLNGGWDGAGNKLGDDCLDTDATVNPGAPEICDGQANNCDGSIPSNEVDDDGDGYVECTLNGGWDGAGTKLGDDCNDVASNNGATVNPDAPELCDGLDNDCTRTSNTDGVPANEVDNDSDGYVECSIDSAGWDGDITATFSEMLGDDCNDSDDLTRPDIAVEESNSSDCMTDSDQDGYGDESASGGGVVAGTDCEDGDDTIYPTATELCDGLDNDCDNDLPTNEVDDDGDGYVECPIDTNGWDTSPLKLGEDCDDGDDTENPGAPEICDGQANNCDGSIPLNEVDNDGDGYVECTLNGDWDGAGTKLGDDCLDTDATVNPGAVVELCDGQDNDCDNVLPTNEVDDDGDGYVECSIDTNGWDTSPSLQGDDCNDDPNNNGDTINPAATEICDGLKNNCTLSSIPANEVDDDGDGYVECTIDSTGWDTIPIKQGDDCDDDLTVHAATVNPGATELCDGLDNDCTRTLNTSGVPVNEVDNDSDGYVECSIDSGGWDETPILQGDDCDDTHALTFPGVAQKETQATACMRDADDDGWGSETAPSGAGGTAGNDCDDTDATVRPDAPSELCDGQVNICDGSLPANEIDNDSDGYVECIIDSGGWDTLPALQGEDCLDTDDTVNPGATELCDGQANDCASTLPSNEVDDDGDGYVECTIDTGGWDDTPTLLGGDCNDVLASINPGATEVCDASDTDEDCDQGADDNDPQAASGLSGMSSWYTDVDGDGYGDENATATQACDAPSATSATNDDCDDADSDTYPGAASEDSPTACMTDADGDDFGSDSVSGTVQSGSDCDDSNSSINTDATEICDSSDTDEDCNGVADDNDSGVTGTTTWYTDSDSDGDGDENDAGVSQCEQPANTSSTNLDCDDSDSNRFGGNTETADEEDEDCDDLVDEGFRSEGDLVISEVMGNPQGFSADITQGQWFEVYNPNATVDFHMGGVEVFTNCDGAGSNSASDSFFIPVDGLVIGALDYAVFCHSSSAAGGACDYTFGVDNGTTSLGASYNEDFDIQTSNTCRISLYFDNRSIILDSVFPRNGTDDWPAVVQGVAYCLDPTTLTAGGNNSGTNWGYPDSTELYETGNYGTPGTAASTCGTTAP